MRARILALVAALGVAVTAAVAAQAARPLATGILDPAVWGSLTPAELGVGYERARAAGASVVRLHVTWSSVAPATRPAQWDPQNPADPAYNWKDTDERIKAAVKHGFTPLVAVNGSPTWSRVVESDSSAPEAADYGAFARAIALRYSGRIAGLPHVRYWQAWIEPNLSPFFQPQFVDGKPVSPDIYRGMVNAFAAGVHGVSSQNRVVAGGTAPFRDITPAVTAIDEDWGPLTFMRQMLCLSPKLKPTCSNPVHFDIWDHHPYTSGGPSHHAAFPDDVSLADLPKMRATLEAASKAHHIVSKGPVQFWVTEFSWDSSPPDPQGVPMPLLTRWVAEGLYTMWQNGISLVIWLQLRDDPPAQSFLQSGLYYRGATVPSDSPKPLLRAFRFPFVAYPRSGAVAIWGRTPTSKSGRVAVEARVAKRWRVIGQLTAGANGIFQASIPVAGTMPDVVRARFAPTDALAVAFSLEAPPDQFFNPFGQPTLLEPKSKNRAHG